ncbi:MAG: murein biosynthesis integral membrane protein MurJ [Tissierellia bacterium]|nr:murein biosynthesis integral membrane protein MurJ [Tissierellia bacterium]
MKALNEKAMKSVRFIIIVGIFTRVLNFIKETLIASNIGCCFETDSYFLAFTATTLSAEIMGEGVSTSLVPVLLKIEAKEGKDSKGYYINNILHGALVFSLILIILNWILSPLVVRILARGFVGEEFSRTVSLMRIGLPMILFIIIRTVYVAYLQSYHAFRAGTKSWIYYNLVYILYLLFFNRYGFHGLMVTGILASALQLYSVIPTCREYGYRYEGILNFKDKYLREFVVMLMPMVIGISINRINVVVDKSVASTLTLGTISGLNYANEIVQLVLGLFITAIVTVFFPIFSQEYNREDPAWVRRVMRRGLDLILEISIPATVILAVLSHPIVKLLFERGEFRPEATLMTSQALTYYALGLGSMALVLILTKAHYATYDSITPMIIGIVGVIINLFLDLLLSKFMGIKGLALATSISTGLITILLIRDLNRKVKVIDIHRDYKKLLILLVKALLMAVLIRVTFNMLDRILIDNIVGEILATIISIGTGIIFWIGPKILKYV